MPEVVCRCLREWRTRASSNTRAKNPSRNRESRSRNSDQGMSMPLAPHGVDKDSAGTLEIAPAATLARQDRADLAVAQSELGADQRQQQIKRRLDTNASARVPMLIDPRPSWTGAARGVRVRLRSTYYRHSALSPPQPRDNSPGLAQTVLAKTGLCLLVPLCTVPILA